MSAKLPARLAEAGLRHRRCLIVWVTVLFMCVWLGAEMSKRQVAGLFLELALQALQGLGRRARGAGQLDRLLIVCIGLTALVLFLVGDGPAHVDVIVIRVELDRLAQILDRGIDLTLGE
jgi:hypothetical protein